MKRLALLVIGLVFLFTTSVFAQTAAPVAPAKDAAAAPAKVEEKKDVKKDVKKKKAAKKAVKKAKKAEKKEMKEKEAAPAPADKQ